MESLSESAAALYASMSASGAVLPAFMVNEDNEAAERHKLSLLAGLVGLAQLDPAGEVGPQELYDALDPVYALEDSCIFSFDELMELISGAFDALARPPFPVPPLPRPDGSQETLEELYAVDLSRYAGKLSGRQRNVWEELMVRAIGDALITSVQSLAAMPTNMPVTEPSSSTREMEDACSAS